MAEKIAFYGDPRGKDGVNKKWFAENTTKIKPPYQMTYADKPIATITVHKKCAQALVDALEDIWVACGKDQTTVEKHKLHRFAGVFNYRLISGSGNLSNHSFACAIDLNAEENGFGVTKPTIPKFAVDAFKKQGARWGGDYTKRKDPMHFEFVSA